MAVKFNPFSGKFDMVGDKAISQVLTGYTSGAGTVASTDTILQAIQKLNGNDALNALDNTVVHLAGSETIAGVKTFSSALKIASALGIQDANGNYLISFPSAVSSAVNYINISNAATSVNPSFSASGTDSNIGIDFVPSGTGALRMKGPIHIWDPFTTAQYRLIADVTSLQVLRIGGANAFSTINLNAGVVNVGGSATTSIVTNGAPGSANAITLTIRTSDGQGYQQDVTLRSGTCAGSSQMSGNLNLSTGNGTGTTTSSGNVLIFTGTATGTRGYVQIGNNTSNLVGFYGTTGVAQAANTVAIDTVLTNLGLQATGSTLLRFSVGFVTGASGSSTYKLTNAGSNVIAHSFIDPAGSFSSSGALGYGWSTGDGMVFTHANGTIRIMGWGVKLTNLVNTAGAESSDIIWTPQNVTDKFIIGGALNLNQFAGTTSRMMEVDSSGNVSAVEDILSWQFSNTTDQTNISARSNWNLKGVYSGTAMSSGQQGQWWYDNDYIYGMIDNSTPFNVPRYSRYKLLNNSVTTTGTPSSTTETDLFSYTTSANTLGTDLEMLDGTVAGTFAANANNKQVKMYFAGTLIFDSTALSLNSGNWSLEFDIVRESSSVVRCGVRFTSSNSTLVSSSKYTRITGLTLSGTNILKVTGTNGTASANDITGEMFKVSWQSATTA